MNQYAIYDASRFRLNLHPMQRRHNGLAVDAKRKRKCDQENHRGDCARNNQRAAAFFHRHEFTLPRQNRFENRNERNFFVHLGVAQRDRRLARQDLQNFDVRRAEKIGIARFERERSRTRPVSSISGIA